MTATTVYVRLLGEGTDVYRPTLATACGNGVYRLHPTAEYDPEDESWEFLPEQKVKCEIKKLHGGDRLIAVQQARARPASATPEALKKASGV
jgi:hypothetical protein